MYHLTGNISSINHHPKIMTFYLNKLLILSLKTLQKRVSLLYRQTKMQPMSLCLPRELAFGANMNLNLFYWKKNSYKENETNTELCRRQVSLGVEHRQKQFYNCFALPLCKVGFSKNQFLSQQSTFSSPSQRFLAVLLSLLPFTSNIPFTPLPNSSIDVWHQLIC